MYPVGATISETVDNVFLFIVGISVLLLLLVTGLMIYFAVKYNRKRHPNPEPVKQKAWLEILWTVIPTILVLAMFYYGYEGFKLMRNVPEDAMTVNVTGRMWEWAFEYDNGKTSDKLHVPVDKPVKLLLKSMDVVHSFYIPSYRVKEDVVPGRETYLWFKPQSLGPADIFCAEFCGQRHAYMLSQVIVMEQAEFDKWYTVKEAPKPMPILELMEEMGCLDCHAPDASEGDRLSLKDLVGQKRVVLEDGKEKEITIDEAYIRRSITNPGDEVVKGQDNVMEVPEEITKEQIDRIVEFLKTGKDPLAAKAGEKTGKK
jgi:cytochrome c oxidase subunit 2